MIIGIDASQAAKEKKTGIEYLSSQLILSLKNIDHKNNYLLFSNLRLSDAYQSNNFKPVFLPFRKFWHKFRLPLAILKYKPEVFLEIGYMLPNFAPKKSICFVHDLASKIFPEAYSPRDRLLLDLSFRKALKSSVIIFISKNSKKDFNKYYPGFSGKSYVIYPGYDNQSFKNLTTPKNVLNLNTNYLLYLGRLESRKNIKNLVLAYKIFRKKNKVAPKLVLAGKEGFGFSEIKTEISKLDPFIKNDIIIPGYISEIDLPHLYAAADLFIFPSRYEGFGIPILEAMACGTAVISSNASSLVEAGGEAAMYFDPTKPEEIADAISTVLDNPSLKSKIIAKGLTQSKKFTYQKMAKEVLEVINSL